MLEGNFRNRFRIVVIIWK